MKTEHHKSLTSLLNTAATLGGMLLLSACPSLGQRQNYGSFDRFDRTNLEKTVGMGGTYTASYDKTDFVRIEPHDSIWVVYYPGNRKQVMLAPYQLDNPETVFTQY